MHLKSGKLSDLMPKNGVNQLNPEIAGKIFWFKLFSKLKKDLEKIPILNDHKKLT